MTPDEAAMHFEAEGINFILIATENETEMTILNNCSGIEKIWLMISAMNAMPEFAAAVVAAVDQYRIDKRETPEQLN